MGNLYLVLFILITLHETDDRLNEAFEEGSMATDYLRITTVTSSKAA